MNRQRSPKRIVHLDPATGASLVETSALQLVQQVRAGVSGAPADRQRAHVMIARRDAALAA